MITCHDLTTFFAACATFTLRGLTFKADTATLTIKFTGGY